MRWSRGRQPDRSHWQTWSNPSADSAALHDGLVQDTPGDLQLPVHLLHGVFPGEDVLPQELRFSRVDVPTIFGVVDDGVVGVGLRVRLEALQAIKQVPGVDAKEPVDADVAHVGLVSRDRVLDVAVFLDVLAAWAGVPLLADLDVRKNPLLACRLECCTA